MSSKKPTPPAGYPTISETTRRAQSQAERDSGIEARKAREREVPEFAGEEITGKYDGEELDIKRRQRTHSDRIERLEKKHDKHEEKIDTLAQAVNNVQVDIGKLDGRFDGQDRVLKNIEKSVDRMAQREHVEVTTSIDVGAARQESEIKVDEAKKIAAVNDENDRRANRRKLITKVVGGVAGGASLVELLHRIFG